MSQQPPDPYGRPPMPPPGWRPPPPPGPYPPPPPGHGMPPAPPHGSPVTDPGPPPASVRWAAILIFGIVVLNLLNVALLPVRRSYLLATMRQDAIAQVPFGVDVDTLVTITIYLIMGWEVLWAGLWLLWGIKVRQGRGWARVLTTIFAIIGIIDFASSLYRLTGTPHPPTYAYLLGLIVTLAELTVIVLVFQRSSGQWMRARKAWRHHQRQVR